VSAIKVAPHHDAMALLGTHLSDAKIDEIKELGYKSIYLSLDNDATGEAIKIQLACRSKLPLLVVALHKDIKNFNKEEMAEYLTRLT